MRVLLLGATGRTGRLVLQRLEARGCEVVTYGRRPGGGSQALVGPIDDTEAVRAAAERADAVISCLASGNTDPVCSTATRTLIASNPTRKRYVVVSGASVALPGDFRGPLDHAAGWLFRQFMGGMLSDREAEMALLQASDLAWTALRPPRLTNGPGRGSWQFTADRPANMLITREDLAGAVVETLCRDDLIGRAPFVSAAPHH